MDRAGAAQVPGADTKRRLSHGDWDALPLVDQPNTDRSASRIAGHFQHPAPDPVAPAGTLSPSDLGGAKALPGDAGLDEEAAKLRGTRLHLLLEHLPVADKDLWPELCARLLPDMHERTGKSCCNEAAHVLTAEGCRPFLHLTRLAEVPVSAALERAANAWGYRPADRIGYGSACD